MNVIKYGLNVSQDDSLVTRNEFFTKYIKDIMWCLCVYMYLYVHVVFECT